MKRKVLLKQALLAAAFFAGLSANAQTLTLMLGDGLEDENYESNFWLDYMQGDVSIAEGTYVQINIGTWHTDVMNIYMNDEVVYTKPSGSLYKDDVYHFTAGTNCKILGGNQNRFSWEINPNVRITQDATVAVTGNSDGKTTPSYWATYYNGTTSYTADANTTVYKAAMNGTSSLTLTEVSGREIPAAKAVILKSTSATITLTPAASTTADLSDNVLKGGTSVTSGYDAYTLSRGSAGTGTVGFYKFSGSLDGSKAHLEIAQSAGARGFIGFGDDGTTAIEAPTATIIVEDGEIYDLMGRRIEGQPTRKGIYVKNGQKFIVK